MIRAVLSRVVQLHLVTQFYTNVNSSQQPRIVLNRRGEKKNFFSTKLKINAAKRLEARGIVSCGLVAFYVVVEEPCRCHSARCTPMSVTDGI